MNKPLIVKSDSDEKFFLLFYNAEKRQEFAVLLLEDLSSFFEINFSEIIDFQKYLQRFFDFYSYYGNEKTQESFITIISNIITYIFTKTNFETLKLMEKELENKKEDENFFKAYAIKLEDFKNLVLLVQEKEERIFLSIDIKKNIKKVLQELPLMLMRILKISLGEIVDTYGKPMTLKEYAAITNLDYEELKEIEKDGKKLVYEKLIAKRGFDDLL